MIHTIRVRETSVIFELHDDDHFVILKRRGHTDYDIRALLIAPPRPVNRSGHGKAGAKHAHQQPLQILSAGSLAQKFRRDPFTYLSLRLLLERQPHISNFT